MNRRSAFPVVPILNVLLTTAIAGVAGNAAFGQEPPTPAAPTPAPEISSAPAATPPADDMPSAPSVTYPTFLFAGFGDIDYGTVNSPSGRQFSLGQLTLQGTSALSQRTFVFGEMTFTARADAGTGTPPAPGYNAEVERLFIRYDQSDALKISAGRFHTPINWWNTAFHHGLWLQTTIARPEMVKFGGQFIPTHFVGAQFEGGVPANGLNLYYNAGFGNGRAAVVSRAGDAGAGNDVPAGLLNVFLRPDKLYGIEVGGAVYRDDVPVTTTIGSELATKQSVRETILSAHLVYQKENPEFIAEYAHISHTDGFQAEQENDAYYVQVAYRQPGGLFKPYYRYERTRVSVNDPVLTETPSLSGHTVGIRYDFTELAALKLEYRDMQRSPSNVAYGASTNGGFAQVSFAF